MRKYRWRLNEREVRKVLIFLVIVMGLFILTVHPSCLYGNSGGMNENYPEQMN